MIPFLTKYFQFQARIVAGTTPITLVATARRMAWGTIDDGMRVAEVPPGPFPAGSAWRYQDDYIGCEHLLLGSSANSAASRCGTDMTDPSSQATDGTAGQVLRALGAEAGPVRQALTAALARRLE